MKLCLPVIMIAYSCRQQADADVFARVAAIEKSEVDQAGASTDMLPSVAQTVVADVCGLNRVRHFRFSISGIAR